MCATNKARPKDTPRYTKSLGQIILREINHWLQPQFVEKHDEKTNR